jgi:hypothetical protein
MTETILEFSTKLDKIVKGFKAPPFLFVGSGLSRRYLGTPSWQELLDHLISMIAVDKYSHSMYIDDATDKKSGEINLPKLASIITEDFKAKWRDDKSFRTNDPELLKQVEAGVKPIKAEVAHYLRSFSPNYEKYGIEIEMLKTLCSKSISGIVTTNYDTFLDELTTFSCYIGQSELLTSSTQGIAEIYKIHGCLEKPETLVFDESDYQNFIDKMKYLSAKLLTIFLEYPVIFLGYSIADTNIRNIFDAILDCLDDGKKALLKDRLLFIEFSGDDTPAYEISSHTISLGSRYLEMTKIRMFDYSILYNSMQRYQLKIPMRILRHLKQAFFEYTITTKASNTIQVLNLDDIDYENEEILVTLGRSSEMSKFGLLGITSDDIYKDIFLDTLISKFQADDILEVIVCLEKSATKLPKYKYLNQAKKQPPSNLRTIECTYDDFLSETVIHDRSKKQFVERSVKGIIKYHNQMPAYYMQFLSEDEMKLEDLEAYLISEFAKDPDIITNAKGGKRSDLKRLIRIYDFLKYKKEL